MAEATPPSTARRPSVAIAILGLFVVTSAVVRSVVAWRHSVPRLFPDEYIYAALGRSIGHGHLEIRGATVHFPGLLEPILAAPIWRLSPITTAYHLVQVENAVAASLAAIPIYYLARLLGLSRTYSVAAGAYALLVPELVLIAFTSSDMIAYPIALSATALGVAAVHQPTRGKQVGFLVFAVLASVARVQYFVLVPAYLAAALVVDRRLIWRKHRLPLIALAPVIAVATIGALGFYASGLKAAHFNLGYGKWFFLQMFLIAVESGVILVPGAIAGLVKPQTPREIAFAVFVGALALLLFGEAALPASRTGEFRERYLFILLPLIPLAFGVYLRRGRPLRAVAVAVASVIFIAAARLPVSEYSAATFKSDSQFLYAVSYAETRLSTGSASLLVALLSAVGAGLAVVLVFRGGAALALALPIGLAVVTTVAATHVDLRATAMIRSELAPALTWVDAAGRAPVTAIETPISLKQEVLYQLYWNTSIEREVLFGTAVPTDPFRTSGLEIGPTGILRNVTGDFLFHNFGTIARFSNVTEAARFGNFTLWHPVGRARIRLAVTGRFHDSWLSTDGSIAAWPSSAGSGVRLSFVLGLPRTTDGPVTIELRRTTITVHPGQHVEVTCENPRGPIAARFRGSTSRVTRDLRFLSAQLTQLKAVDIAAPANRKGESCAVA